MMRVHVREGAGREPLMPNGRRLPKEGARVKLNMFIQRCIDDGDLVVVAPVPGDAAAVEEQPG